MVSKSIMCGLMLCLLVGCSATPVATVGVTYDTVTGPQVTGNLEWKTITEETFPGSKVYVQRKVLVQKAYVRPD